MNSNKNNEEELKSKGIKEIERGMNKALGKKWDGKIIDWSIIKNSIENNWFESNPPITDAEIDDMAIGISRDVDDFIVQREEKAIEKRSKLIGIVTAENDESENPHKLIGEISKARWHELEQLKKELGLKD